MYVEVELAASFEQVDSYIGDKQKTQSVISNTNIA